VSVCERCLFVCERGSVCVGEGSVSGMGCVCVRDVGGVCVSEMCLGVRCVGFVCEMWEVCGVCV